MYISQRSWKYLSSHLTIIALISFNIQWDYLIFLYKIAIHIVY